MLTIVDLSDNRKRFLEKLRKHKTEISRLCFDGAEPVFLIKSHRKYTDFEKLHKIIVRFGKALFLCDDVPPELNDLKFEEKKLPLKMLVKTAAEFYKLEPKVRRKITLTVFDDDACACGETAEICKYVRCVRVITSKCDVYEKCADSVFRNCGACILVSNNKFTAQGSDILLARDDRALGDIEFKKAVVYKKHTNKLNVFELNQTLGGYCDADITALGIDKFVFLCALYEECSYAVKQIPIFCRSDVFKSQTKA